MTKITLGAVALMVLTGEAQAQKDGNQLYAVCTSNSYSDQGVCSGYVEAAAEYLEWVRSGEKKPPCLSDGTVVRQVKDVVVNYLRDHPTERSYTGTSLVVRAITLAWKCQ